jgi:hypothetical protein
MKDLFEIIDYYKYLKCQECRKIGLYCLPHRLEVEKILARYREHKDAT